MHVCTGVDTCVYVCIHVRSHIYARVCRGRHVCICVYVRTYLLIYLINLIYFDLFIYLKYNTCNFFFFFFHV